MKWSEVIGQEEVKNRLRELVAGRHIPHALMLSGETGYGTLALAMAFASTLLCRFSLNKGRTQEPGLMDFGQDSSSEHSDITSLPISDASQESPDTEACGDCPQCSMLRHWQHPDLHFSFPTVKSPSMAAEHKPVSDDFMREWYEVINREGPYLSFDLWLEEMKTTTQQAIITAAESDALARKISLTSSQGGYKVAVIWLAERMNEESANKILKTLEEPTDKTVFILVVEHPERLLETIRSRVQTIDVPRIDCRSMEQELVARRGLDLDTARHVARASEGNWITAVEMLSPDSERRLFLDLFIMLMRQVYARDVRGMKKWSETTGAFGREKQKRLLTYFMRMIREAFVSNFHNEALSYMTVEEGQFVKKFGPFINETNVIEINALLELAHRDISQNTNQKIVFYDTALRLTVLLLRKPSQDNR